MSLVIIIGSWGAVDVYCVINGYSLTDRFGDWGGTDYKSTPVGGANRFEGYDIFDFITGGGARFDSNNNFVGFLEPSN